MKTSSEIDKIAGALASAQGQFTNLEKNREVEVQMKSGGKYKFKYATFDECVAMVRPILADHELAFTQSIEIGEKGLVVVESRLLHASGQWLCTELVLVPDSDTPQAIGSAATYGRRYAASALLCLASEDDDDANAASGNRADTTKHEPPKSRPAATTASKPKADPKAPVPMTPEQIAFNEWAAPKVKAGELTRDEIVRRLDESGHNYAQVRADIEAALAELEPPKV